jgi:hypothetical protein
VLPVEKLLDHLIYRIGMGNRAHVAKTLELHKLDSRQCGHQ